jgi:coenzyme F420-reducing hydrogenase gamma subunit
MTTVDSPRVRVAVHKFSSCDGCQLAFLNMGETLLTLAGRVNLVHFAEAGMVDEQAQVDVSFVEGSISTHGDVERIKRVRANSGFVVTIGACATTGGLQALRNLGDSAEWVNSVYASPEYISALDKVTPIKDHIKVDLELWGCPVNSHQVVQAVNSLLSGTRPRVPLEKVCQACKRSGAVCVMVTQGVPCMGPVTQTGCGAICPRYGRDCYGCYGPVENANTEALSRRFEGLGLPPGEIAGRFLSFTNAAPVFNAEGMKWKTQDD